MGYTAIIDYGVGNLKSVANAFAYIGEQTQIATTAKDLELADAIILPGVGAFPDAAQKLKESGMQESLLLQVGKKPILGICLGMQLLFDRGEEVSPCQGLSLIGGTVAKIETEYKLPHIGWNQLQFQNNSPLFRGLPEESYVYFVHSFCGYATDESQVIARTQYGPSVVAAVAHNGVYGCQFHPEKSGDIGLEILKNFGGLAK